MNIHIQKLRRIKSEKFWKYFLEHKKELKLILDNDDTVIVSLEEDFPGEFASPPSYLGDSDGLCDLLSALDINFEYC